MAANDVDYAGGKGAKPPQSKCRKICRAIYNPDKGEFLGRTCASWAKIGVFYLVFYSCLAGFFAIMLMGFFATLDDNKPTMTEMYSLLKGNPGMGFRPVEVTESALIKYNISDNTTYIKKVDDILTFLRNNGYISDNNQPSNITVDGNGNETFGLSSAMFPSDGCGIDPNDVYKSFGYAEGKPCVLLKINKIYGWEPKRINKDTWSNETRDLLGVDFTVTDDIVVRCIGENDGDHDSMGHVDYFPPTGFAFKYFPFVNAKNYRSPIVFAKFTNVKKGRLLQIWCKMYAGNIKIHKNDKAGSIRFELQVDDDKIDK